MNLKTLRLYFTQIAQHLHNRNLEICTKIYNMSWDLLLISQKQNGETFIKAMTKPWKNFVIEVLDNSVPFLHFGSHLKALRDSKISISDYLFLQET